MTFSVVIPTRNRRHLLERALASVWLQEHPPHEVIVVNDGSTDDTDLLLYTLRDRVIVVTTPGGSPGAARNAGAEAASGDYVAFLDSDDQWFPWTLSTFAAVIDAQRPSYVCGSFLQFKSDAELAAVKRAPLEAESFDNYYSTWPRQLVIGAGMIAVRRDVFLDRGGFSTSAINLEDHDLSLKLGLDAGFVQIVRPHTLAWRLHDGGVTRDLPKSLAGCEMLLANEQAAKYPGGTQWEPVRRNIITTHTRSFTFEAIRAGRIADAWRIYRATFGWHVALHRLRYLAVFPFMAAARSLQSPGA